MSYKMFRIITGWMAQKLNHWPISHCGAHNIANRLLKYFAFRLDKVIIKYSKIYYLVKYYPPF